MQNCAQLEKMHLLEKRITRESIARLQNHFRTYSRNGENTKIFSFRKGDFS